MYDTIIQESRVKSDLPSQVTLSKETINSCMKPDHKLHVAHPGPSSPIKKVEALMLEMILLLGDTQVPVTCIEKG